MEYTVRLSEDEKIVAAWATGEWDAVTDNKMVHQVLERVDATGCRKVLLDIRELHFDFPIAQIFGRAKEIGEQRRHFVKVSTKTAIVYPSTNRKVEEDMLFFENATRNRGLPYRIFKDIEDAITWLLEDES